MSTTADDLYALLPAIYRRRDAEQGLVLRALVEVLASQAGVVERDIEALYDNWFIETCAPWVVPYIGDLLRVRPLSVSRSVPVAELAPGPPTRITARAYVANTLGYRRAKGTVAVLERLAYDVTGWRAKAVEFFQLLATTQHVNHVRPFSVRTPDLRDTIALELLDGPFDRVAHTAEVRPVDLDGAIGRPASPRTRLDAGRYGIANVGLFMWRLQAYPVTASAARLVDATTAGFTFSPLGLDGPLFNLPDSEPGLEHLATEDDVPGIVRRRALYEELEQRRQALVDGAESLPTWFRDAHPVLRVARRTASDAALVEIPPAEIDICDLNEWHRPPSTREYTPAGGPPPVPLPLRAGVDPLLGRVTFPAGTTPVEVQVSFSYGFSADIGGGPYDKRGGVSTWLEPAQVTWQRGVTADPQVIAGASDPALLVDNLTDAVTAWNAHASATPRAFGILAIMDSATYTGSLTGASELLVPAGCRLAVVGAGWPEIEDDSAPGGRRRRTGDVAADQLLRPHVHGSLSVRGTAPTGAPDPGALILDGLLIEGKVTVEQGNLGTLRIIDSTLVPASGGLVVTPAGTPGVENVRLAVIVERSITGPLSLRDAVPSLHIGSTVVDRAGGKVAIDASGAATDIQRSTIIGTTSVERLDAGNAVFTDAVVAARLQAGCVRFSALPDTSPTRVARRYRCQPDLALKSAPAARHARVRAELAPAFTSTTYGEPGYAQLAFTCADGIATGAEDGSEMGAFSSLLQPQREANLRIALEEYLRSGLDAGIFYVT